MPISRKTDIYIYISIYLSISFFLSFYLCTYMYLDLAPARWSCSTCVSSLSMAMERRALHKSCCKVFASFWHHSLNFNPGTSGSRRCLCSLNIKRRASVTARKVKNLLLCTEKTHRKLSRFFWVLKWCTLVILPVFSKCSSSSCWYKLSQITLAFDRKAGACQAMPALSASFQTDKFYLVSRILKFGTWESADIAVAPAILQKPLWSQNARQTCSNWQIANFCTLGTFVKCK